MAASRSDAGARSWWRRPWLAWLAAVTAVTVGGAVMSTEWAVVLAVLALASWGAAWLVRRRTGAGDLVAALGAVAVVVLLAQLVPYGRDHTNPPVTGEPEWDSPATRELATRACFDCHSNETAWPWYTNVAPMSWITQRHVDEGRDEVNYSEYDRRRGEAEESAETVREGSMPPFDYVLAHPDARLTDAEKQALVDGLAATFGDEGGGGGEDGGADDEDGDDD
jgi:hypothetical protein